jgi:hypothetical protein
MSSDEAILLDTLQAARRAIDFKGQAVRRCAQTAYQAGAVSCVPSVLSVRPV